MVLHSLKLYFALQNHFILTFTEILGFLCRIAARRRAAHCRNLRLNWIAHNSSRVTIPFPPLIPCVTSPIMHSECEGKEWIFQPPKENLLNSAISIQQLDKVPDQNIPSQMWGHSRATRPAVGLNTFRCVWAATENESNHYTEALDMICVSALTLCVYLVFHGRLYWPNQTAQNTDKLIKVLPQNRNTWSLEYYLDTWKQGKK